MSIKSEIIKNVLFRWGGFIISGAVGFFMFPFVVNMLGSDIYGAWILVGSLTGYLTVLDLGIGIAIVKFVSEARANNDSLKLNRIASTSFASFLLIGFICVFASVLAAFLAPKFFDTGSVTERTFRYLILVSGLQIAIGFPLGVFRAIIKGYKRYDVESSIDVLSLILRASLIVFFLLKGRGILTVALVCLLSSVVGHFLSFSYVSAFIKGIRIRAANFKKETGILIGNFSIFTFIAIAAASIASYSDSVVIGVFLSSAAITYYAVGMRLLSFLREFIIFMCGVLIPVASEFGTDASFRRNQKLLIAGTKYSAIIALFVIGLLLSMGKSIIRFWIGYSYVEQAYPILIILAAAEFFATPQLAMGAVLLGLARHRFYAILSSAQALANLCLSVILVKYLGLKGVALGTAIPYAASILFFIVYTCGVVELSPANYFKKAFLPVFAGAIPFLLFCIYASGKPMENVKELFIMIGLGAAVFSTGIFISCFNKRRYNDMIGQAAR